MAPLLVLHHGPAGGALGHGEILAPLLVLHHGPNGSALGHGEIVAPLLVLHHGPAGGALGHGEILAPLLVLHHGHAGSALAHEEILAPLLVLHHGPTGGAFGRVEILAPPLVLELGPAGGAFGHGEQLQARGPVHNSQVEAEGLLYPPVIPGGATEPGLAIVVPGHGQYLEPLLQSLPGVLGLVAAPAEPGLVHVELFQLLCLGHHPGVLSLEGAEGLPEPPVVPSDATGRGHLMVLQLGPASIALVHGECPVRRPPLLLFASSPGNI